MKATKTMSTGARACASSSNTFTPNGLAEASPPTEVFIRVQGLCERYRMSRGAIYNLIALPEFPKAIYLNTKVPLFRMDEVVAFEESRRQRMGVKGGAA